MNLSSSTLRHISIHFIGNKLHQQDSFYAQSELSIDNDLSEKIKNALLSKFGTTEEKYRFHHPSDLKFNEVYNFAKAIFEDTGNFHQTSIHIAKHLYEQSSHPKIKEGELYVCLFDDIEINGTPAKGLGIFKTENKSTFYELDKHKQNITIKDKEGIDLARFDKGCLIFDTEKEQGYVLCVIDNINKGNEAQYWKDSFLGILIINNDFHKTNQFLGITKQFVTRQLDEDFEVSKADKIDFLNRSVDYFKNHETFDQREFEEEVFGDNNVIESFRKFDQHYRVENEVELSDHFDISALAVKKQARVFKSVLKLDKNFHIYIHGDRELIEQGVDENGRKYYKIYYENEA